MDGKSSDENCRTMLESVGQYRNGQYADAYETAQSLIAKGEVPASYLEPCAWII